MYDRIVDVPRLTAHFGPGAVWPQPLRAAQRVAERFAGVRFNSAGLNLYRDGNDSVAMHNDHTAELIDGSPVLLISLGGTRRMRIHSCRAKPSTSRSSLGASCSWRAPRSAIGNTAFPRREATPTLAFRSRSDSGRQASLPPPRTRRA